jgi:hypothetical protein
MTIIERVAQEHGISPDECRAAIQEVISTAWATTDPAVKQRQIRLAGEGIPTPEEFISLISRMVGIDKYY